MYQEHEAPKPRYTFACWLALGCLVSLGYPRAWGGSRAEERMVEAHAHALDTAYWEYW